VDRRRFDHLAMELSLALGARVPRYPLWLHLHEAGRDPETLSREDAIAYCDADLGAFLAGEGLCLSRRALRQIRRAVDRFDPDLPDPADRFARLNELEP